MKHLAAIFSFLFASAIADAREFALSDTSRPQDPRDFPYKREEVAFINPKAGDTLRGTLTIPASGQFSKVLVLITGSGPQNRDEEVKQFNHRPFLVWSDWLTRKGFAVLRYDDRGIGGSTGNFSASTTADFSDDAEAAVDFLAHRADMRNAEIGLLGHSEGGMIAPMVAEKDRRVKFLVLLAAPGLPGVSLMHEQVEDQLHVLGISDSLASISLQKDDRIKLYIRDHSELTASDLKKQLVEIATQDAGAKAAFPKKFIDSIAGVQLTPVVSPWYRYFLGFVPADHLRKVKCPVLALNGSMDKQVRASTNLAAIGKALKEGGNEHYTQMLMPGLNHLFQKATTGSVREYGEISETVDPVALQAVTDWLSNLN